MAAAPDELTFEEASAPVAEAPEEITFEEGHDIDPEAIRRGIELGPALTQTVRGVITSPAAAEASVAGRQQAAAERAAALPFAVTAPQQATGALIQTLAQPAAGIASEQARAQAQRQREREAVQRMGRIGLDPAAMAGVLPEEAQAAPAQVGRALQTAGRFLYGGLADIGMDITGQSLTRPGETAPLGNIEALLTGQPMPAETARRTLGPVLGSTLAASQGLISTAPQMLAVAGLQSVGVPAPLAAAVIFGTTAEGFEPKQAAIAAALPFVGKYGGEVVGALARKLGVSTTRAQNIFKGLGGTAAAAAYMGTIQESEIEKLPPDQQNQARIDALANIMSQVALGPMGVEFKGATPAELAGIALSRQVRRGELTSRETALVERGEAARPFTQEVTATGQPVQVLKGAKPARPETALEKAERESREAKEAENVMIGERIKAGKVVPENVVVTINPPMKMGDKTIPGFVQVDEIDPTKTDPMERDVWSNNAETLRKFGFDIPSTEELLKLKGGQYRLTQIREMIKGVKPTAPEQITAAAYRTPEGKVETGANHPEILKRLGVPGFETAESRNTPQFGFVTDKGRFITREEAGPISKESGQDLKKFEPGEPVHSDEVSAPGKPTTPISETQPAPKLTEDQVRDLVGKAAQIVRTRKLTPADRRAFGVEMENARAGAPEKLQALVERLSQAELKVAPKIKGGPQGRFNAETEAHGYDLLAWINENMKLLSKSGAKKLGRYARNSADWDDAPSSLSAPHHSVIYSERGFNPTDVAQKAFEAGKLSEPSASALWAEIKAASAKRAGAVVGAKRQAKILAEEGPQFERWQAVTTAPSEAHPIELTTEEMAVGDTIKVSGETLRVSSKDRDSGELKLVDGDRFGTQTLMEGEKIYVAEHIRKPTKERPGEVFSRVEHPGGEAGAAIRAHGTTTGLPPDVPDGGPHFGAELMAAAQRLGTVVRTRATLGAGVLGQYTRRRAGVTFSDKIEVGELSNQNTMAHEIGHDLDQYLWPSVDLAYSMKSLAVRAGIKGTGREFHDELKGVSVLMRGPIAGSKAYVNYRNRAAELIADYFALYAHDPARARTMTPKWSKVFEGAVRRFREVDSTIKQLHAGNVVPVPPVRPVGPVGAPAAMPGAVPPMLPRVAVSPDANLFNIAADMVRGLVRKFRMEVIRAQIKADSWRRLVPIQIDRNDVGGFVEGIGNLEIPGDTIGALRGRMTPEKFAMVKRYKYAIENVRGEVNDYLKGMTDGEYLSFLQDYLPHFYDSKSAKGQAALGRFLKNSPNAKQRKIPTLQEAVEYGLTPISQDPAVLYELHSRINWRVATNRMLIGQLGEMKTSSGEKVLVPWGEAPPGYIRSDNPLIQRIYAMKSKGATMLWRGGAGIHPDAWMAVRQMLEMPTHSTLANAYDAVNAVTRANAFAFSLFHDITLRAAATGAGAIHLGIPRTVGEIPEKLNPFRGLVRVFEKNPLTGELEIFRSTKKLGQQLMNDEEAATDAARHGLIFSWNDSESYQMAARDFLDRAALRWKDNPILGPTTRLLRNLQMLRQRSLWKNTHDAFKIIAYHDLTAKALAEAPPGTNPRIVKEQIASLLNDAFGGQEWQTKFWLSPQNRRMLARAFLAPDWTFSTLRSVPLVSDIASTIRGQAPRLAGREPIPVTKEGWNGNMMRYRFWRGELAAIATATIATQYAVYHAFGNKDKGDKEWVWENEDGQRRRVDITPIMRKMPWKDPNDPTRYYMNLGKRPEEILAYFTQADQIMMSKAARPVAEVLRQVTGTEGDFKAQWKRDHETFLESIPERALKGGGVFLPFVFSGNQFALSLPYRKGMTKYKAQQAYESTYELAADPGLFPSARAFLRGVPPPDGTLREMVEQITDAAERNGVPTEEIRKRALSSIRGKYYDKFFKASQKGDEKAMDKAAIALENLGATGAQLHRSMKRRAALEPYAE